MRIGFDLGDTIISTKEQILKYEILFCKENKIEFEELHSNKNLSAKFMRKYLRNIYIEAKVKEGIKEVFDKLFALGHEIYIITSRTNEYMEDVYGLTANYFDSNFLEVTKIFVDGKNKVKFCKELNIDVFFDDNINNFKSLIDNNIKAILFDDENKFPMVYNRIIDWNEFFNNVYVQKYC